MKRGFALLEIVVVLAVLLGGAWFVKPSLFPGESKRAANSAKTTEQLIAATDRPAAVVAASIVKIAEANAETQPSAQKSFIAEESGLALTLLPPADATALIAAERRKAAVLEGRVAEARSLYETAAKGASQMQRERDAAISAKRAADDALMEAAAINHAQTIQLLAIGALAILALAAWAYAKFYGITPQTLGQIVHDVRAGKDLVDAMDIALPPRLHGRVAKARKLAAP